MTFALKADMNDSPKKRTLSRLAAVQALYQQGMTGLASAELVAEYQSYHFKQKLDDIPIDELDRELFNDLVLGAGARILDIDKIIAANLAEGWSMERTDPLLIAILRCAIYELWCRTDIPPKVTISEYVAIACDFYAAAEPKFINGVLDKVAQKLREFGKGVT